MSCIRRNYSFCILVVLLKLPAFAASITLMWTPSADPMVTGYNLYYGSTSGIYTKKISVGNATHATVSGLVPGTTYYFVATTYIAAGMESPFSSEVSYLVPLNAIAVNVNQPPTLNALGDLVVNENASVQTVKLSGITSGAANEKQRLTVTAASSSVALIPKPAVKYTSPNTTGFLTFKPVPNKTGTAVITVTVRDGGRSNNIVSRTFAVTVAGQPVLGCQLTNQVALVGQTRTFAIKATGRGALKYQWNYNGTILISAAGSALLLNNVTTNQSGIYSVTVTDGNGSTNSTASLTVYATATGSLAPAGYASDQYTMVVGGVPGCRYIVQASTDFVNWVPAQTNTAPFTFVDTNASRFGQRFYRSVYAP